MITDNELRIKIRDIIQGSGTAQYAANFELEVGTMEAGQSEEFRWNGLLLPRDFSQLPSSLDHLRGKIHSWQIIGTPLVAGQKRQGGGRRNHYRGYGLRGVIEYWDNGEGDNSSKFVGSEIESIMESFARRERLELDQTTDGVLWHDEVQLRNNVIRSAGNTRAHVINLYLGIHLFKNL